MSKQINREKVIINQEHTTIESKQIIKKGNGFADVAGMEDLKNELETKLLILYEDLNIEKNMEQLYPMELCYTPTRLWKNIYSKEIL